MNKNGRVLYARDKILVNQTSCRCNSFYAALRWSHSLGPSSQRVGASGCVDFARQNSFLLFTPDNDNTTTPRHLPGSGFHHQFDRQRRQRDRLHQRLYDPDLTPDASIVQHDSPSFTAPLDSQKQNFVTSHNPPHSFGTQNQHPKSWRITRSLRRSARVSQCMQDIPSWRAMVSAQAWFSI